MRVNRDTSVWMSAGAVAFWLVSYVLVLLGTRHPRLRPGPRTEDLRPESPAMVALITHQLRPGPDLAEATIFDLAARRYLEFRQQDTARTTVHIGSGRPSELSEHEQKVLDRLSAAASAGVVRMDRMDLRDLDKIVIRDARESGLAAPRFNWRAVGWLASGAVIAGGVVGGSIYWATENNIGFIAGLLTALALGGLIMAGQRVQLSKAGVEAAQHWLGVRDFMKSYRGFSEQSPATIARWERYLAYGVALGVSRAASQAIAVPGDHAREWTTRAGDAHRVSVIYPRGWDHYGRTFADLMRQAAMRLLPGAALLLFWRGPWFRIAMIIGGYLVLRGVYLLIRGLLDQVVARRFTGTVLWREPWRKPLVRQELYVWRVPRVDYLVVDDGRSDVLTAWAVPKTTRAEPGQAVRIKVHPWTRRITEAALVESSTWHLSSSEPRSRV